MTLTTDWVDYSDYRPGPNSVVGSLRALPQVWSEELGNKRDLLVWLPDSYHTSEKRYPVMYMQDGQNLFDSATAFGGNEWGVDETMTALGAEGIEAIIVGTEHGGADRIPEYNPFAQPPKNGARYLDFVTGNLKPIIDRDFRTLPQREATGILGSSMGGLISLFAFFHRPEVFGLAGAMSPAFWIGRGAIYDFVRKAPTPPGKIYLDNGTRENNAEGMAKALVEKGYVLDATLKYVKEEGGEHTESAWARRLPEALRFLLG
jgi:predicted alpha/beta superfamily hydrolase